MRNSLLPALLLAVAAHAQGPAGDSLIVDPGREPDEVVLLWPAGAPGGDDVDLTEHYEERSNPYGLADRSVTDITAPTLSVFRAADPDGSAILIAPGGGYARIVVEHEGWESARWFSRRGPTVYVMTYRLPHQGWAAGAEAPLQDIQRAIRLIRARAGQDDVDASRVMVLGFSAGGHLAGSLATRFGESTYSATDAVDRLSARPDAAALIYPVVTMRELSTHMGSRRNLIGEAPSDAAIARYSLETSPPADTPPVILIHAGDDTAVPVENSIGLYRALKTAGIPAALHVFETGGHGFGMRGLDDGPLAIWPRLVMDFGRAHGIFDESERTIPRGAEATDLLHEVWEIGRERIAPAELATRFDAAMLGEIEATLRGTSGLPLADVLNPFLTSLGVSHTRFYDRRHQTYYLLRSMFSTRDIDSPALYTVGVQLDDAAPGLILAVLDGSPAELGGLRAGERIIAVNGADFESLLQWQHPGRTRLTIRGPRGERDVSITPVLQGFHRALERATAASRTDYVCRDGSVGYLHLWAGTNDAFLDDLRAWARHAREAGQDSVILDLRDGYGGAWYDYLDAFFANRETYFSSVDYRRAGPTEARQAAPQDNPDAFPGPVVVLINAGTRSGKEALAHQFKRSGRATLIGTTTAGALMGGMGGFADRDDGYMLYLAVQETRLDGTVIEGVGVSPDIVVTDAGDYDAPLRAALDRLDCA